MVTLTSPAAPVDDLIGALSSPREADRIRAAERLEKAPPDLLQKAVPALAAALRDASWEVRLHSSECLKRAGPTGKSAAPALVAALQDKFAGVRHNAAEALRRIGKPAVAALVTSLTTGDENARFSAAKVLGDIGTDARQDLRALVHVAVTDKPHIRLEAAHAIVRIAPDDANALRVAVGPLVRELEDKSSERQERAASSLSRAGTLGKPAVPVLVELLADPQYRFQAALSLWRLGPVAKAALPALRSQLADKANLVEPGFRMLLAGAIRRMDPTDKAAATALAGLIDVLALSLTDSGSDDLPIHVAEALGDLGSNARRALPALRKAACGENAKWREAARRAIRRIEGDAP